jgi:hypothetical protein
MALLEGKTDLLEACRHRKLKVAETPANLLETQVKAEGILDGMDVRIEMHCIAGMPGDSQGSILIQGNLGQILAVLERLWPVPPAVREVVSPGRKSWPDRVNQKASRP